MVQSEMEDVSETYNNVGNNRGVPIRPPSQRQTQAPPLKIFAPKIRRKIFGVRRPPPTFFLQLAA